MKKILVCLAAIFALGIAANAANSYTVSDEAIDAVIENCTEANVAASVNSGKALKIGSAPEPIIAFALGFIPVTSWLAIHRMYMGTAALPVVLNIITGAGFGIVYLVDWIMLLIGVLDDDISKYCGNTKWLMWL